MSFQPQLLDQYRAPARIIQDKGFATSCRGCRSSTKGSRALTYQDLKWVIGPIPLIPQDPYTQKDNPRVRFPQQNAHGARRQYASRFVPLFRALGRMTCRREVGGSGRSLRRGTVHTRKKWHTCPGPCTCCSLPTK